MNKTLLIGNLIKDPELTETSNGVKVCRFSIAVNRNYTSADGERKTDFFNCVAWRGLGENLAKYARKGNKVAVSGSFEQRSYENSEGVKKTVYELMTRGIEFLTPKANVGETGDEQSKLQAFDDDSDIPF